MVYLGVTILTQEIALTRFLQKMVKRFTHVVGDGEILLARVSMMEIVSSGDRFIIPADFTLSAALLNQLPFEPPSVFANRFPICFPPTRLGLRLREVTGVMLFPRRATKTELAVLEVSPFAVDVHFVRDVRPTLLTFTFHTLCRVW